MKLSVCMIVKNEKEMLARCLESVKGADEFVICDTGSTDNTVEIARTFTSLVYTDFVWCDDFATARNHALSKCTGDWILSIDADEVLEQEGIQKIRSAILEAEKKGLNAINIILESAGSQDLTPFPRVFKRSPNIFWVGKDHECINTHHRKESNIKIIYGRSPAHDLDPDRNLRILMREVGSNPKCIREVYYLAREYWYRGKFEIAASIYEKYLQRAVWLPEKADAYLMLARCYWNLRKYEEARRACYMAIDTNINFKEAFLFLAEMSIPSTAVRWKEFAEKATNENVLFVRTK